MSLKLAGLLFTGPFAVETTEVRARAHRWELRRKYNPPMGFID
jgi:hypothetical protein